MEFTIERFKNIERVNLIAGDINLIVGGNNAGKSSILQALQFGVSAAQTAHMQGGIWKQQDRLSTSIGQSDLVYAPIKDVLSLARNGQLKEKEGEAIRITYKDGVNECRVTVKKGRNKNISIEIVGRTLGERLQSVSTPFSALVTGLAGIPSEERFEANIVVRKAAAKGNSNSVFRNILLQLHRMTEKWEVFQSQVQALFPGYTIQVSYDPDKDDVINCNIERDAILYPIDSCGTGVLQAIQIFAYVNLFSPNLLLLDEPDSHLHPNNQKLLASVLTDVASRGTKIVVCSHSKHIISALADSAKFIWVRNGKQEDYVDKYEIQALIEIGALNAGERLGNPSYVFLTEDSNCELLKVLIQANGFNLDCCEVVSYAGCTQIGTAVALISHFRKTIPDAVYIIHRDRDFLPQEKLTNYSEKFSNLNVKSFFPEGNDIEFYFLNIEHLSISCNISHEVAREVLESAFESRKEELTKKYINTIVDSKKKDGDKVNSGEIAVQCGRILTSPHSSAVHGKIMFKAVRDELRERRIVDNVISPSCHLRIQFLVDVLSADTDTTCLPTD